MKAYHPPTRTKNIVENKFEDYCVLKIDEYLLANDIQAPSKRKFSETREIEGIVYKYSHFGIEVIKDQVTIFGRYKSKYFDAELYETTDKLLDELLPTILEYHNNPILTKHPIVRFFSKFCP